MASSPIFAFNSAPGTLRFFTSLIATSPFIWQQLKPLSQFQDPLYGIKDPRGAGAIAQIELHDNEAMGTSGDYQRHFMKDGKRHPHIIDPRSGDTIDLVASVTIITGGGTDAGTRSDGNSKPLFIVGPQHWKRMAQRLGLTEVMLIGADRKVELTPAMRDRMVWNRSK
jgi:thiamine biosynthesis lipoprotein